MNYRWTGTGTGQDFYAAYIDGIEFCWTYDSGTGNPEKAGSGSLLARHFFKSKHQEHFKAVFGEIQFREICKELDAAYKKYISKIESE